MTRKARAGAAFTASVLPTVAAISSMPGDGWTSVVAGLAAGALTAAGITYPAGTAEALARMTELDRSTYEGPVGAVRTAAVGVSSAVTAAWAFLSLPDAVAGGAVTLHLVAAAYAAYRGTDARVQLDADQEAHADQVARDRQSLSIREGNLKRSKAEAEAEHQRGLEDIRDGRAQLAADRAALDADVDAHRRKAAGVPEGATGTRAQVAWELFQADPKMSGRTLAKRLRAAKHRIDTGRVGALLDVMREAHARRVQADLVALEAAWDAAPEAARSTEAEAVDGC